MDVLVSPEEYERLRQVQAYLEMLRLSRLLQDCDVTANELSRASREGLEARHYRDMSPTWPPEENHECQPARIPGN